MHGQLWGGCCMLGHAVTAFMACQDGGGFALCCSCVFHHRAFGALLCNMQC